MWLLLHGTSRNAWKGGLPPLFHRRSLSHGHPSEAAHAISAGSLDLGFGGDVLHVCLHPPLCYSSEGPTATCRNDYGDTSVLGTLGLGLVPTADSPGPVLLDVPHFCVPSVNVDVIKGLDARKICSVPITPADCSSWTYAYTSFGPLTFCYGHCLLAMALPWCLVASSSTLYLCFHVWQFSLHPILF